VSAFLIQPALLMGIVLFGLRRWMLPFGMLTLVLLLNTALLSLLHDQVCHASERRNQYASLSAFTPPVQTAPPMGQDGGDLPPEYRDALSPLAHQTDIVVVPIAGERPPKQPQTTGWRMSSTVNQLLEVARRDPGCRVLVAVNVRYCHHMRRALGKCSEIRIVCYAQL
jgi:hypothetical protein